MRDISSFRKALWCGAAATALFFTGFAVVLPPGGNYAGMLGYLTGMCFMPAVIAGGIASLGGQPRRWVTVAGIYVATFMVLSALTTVGRDTRTRPGEPASEQVSRLPETGR